ncbi:MAG: CNNM domain-containing protein [Paraglaciecola polaris]|uniref:CNNM domain-containing protein n=1 Tax=Paraglaciecola polaris TaxID=222814 RepID=UPI0030015C63
MILLLFYIALALGVSFICSIAEAVILSVSSSYISVLEKQNHKSGALLRKQIQNINNPLAAILTLNTVAHTMGAAGAGAQAAAVFGEVYMGVISAILTLFILVFSEIIPKTLGATFWRKLAPVTAHFLKYLILCLYPFVVLANKLTAGFSDDSPLKGLSKAELAVLTDESYQEGQIARQEANILQNLLSLDELKIKKAMTHRTVIFSVPEDMTVEAFYHKHGTVEFSRIPIYEQSEPEKITGYVLKKDILLAMIRKNEKNLLSVYRKDMVTLLSSMPLSAALHPLHTKRANMLLVVDEYGGLEGILTDEDLTESLLGVEIVDENDKNVSMKKLARLMWKRRERAALQKNTQTKS